MDEVGVTVIPPRRARVTVTFTAERPGPDAGDGPWSVEYAVEVTPLGA